MPPEFSSLYRTLLHVLPPSVVRKIPRSVPLRNAVSSARQTAAKRGARFCTKTRTQAALISPLIQQMQTQSMPVCGRRGVHRGAWIAAVLGADSIAARMAVTHGNNSQDTDCLMGPSAVSAWRQHTAAIGYGR